MILKGFKEKSIRKHISKTLSKREVLIDSSKIKRVGVIINEDEAIDNNWFLALIKTLNVRPNNFKILSFTKQKNSKELSLSNSYNAQSIGLTGKVKDLNLKEFLDTDFDLLISYYDDKSIYLSLVTALVKANFKVGLLQTDERLNDLIIKTKIENFTTFKIELLKYLSVLNKM